MGTHKSAPDGTGDQNSEGGCNSGDGSVPGMRSAVQGGDQDSSPPEISGWVPLVVIWSLSESAPNSNPEWNPKVAEQIRDESHKTSWAWKNAYGHPRVREQR